VKVLITGANGFLGKNLQLSLAELGGVHVVCFNRSDDASLLPHLLNGVTFVFHLAGANRPKDPAEFISGNTYLTQVLCDAIAASVYKERRKVSLIFSSTTQATSDNSYGKSKLDAEEALLKLQHDHGVDVHIFRLPNIFGKWCKPNYNSVVATFCHNVSRDLPIHVDDPDAQLQLVYIDDVIKQFLGVMDCINNTEINLCSLINIEPQFFTTVGRLALQIIGFKNDRTNLKIEHVGAGYLRSLYATYLSYLPPESFTYAVPRYKDKRGDFVEIIKTPDCGQFSYFTALPGATRGGHYHHTKNEKFLLVKGRARFRFCHMFTGDTFELTVSAENSEIVESVPGWSHDIKNIGTDEMVVLLWTNEVFDKVSPDTYSHPL
jgi:UDP-2-acetamido-2,6-beta-L-arabino-hexul-4-ose reductase